MKFGILMAIGVAMVALGVSGLVLRVSEASAVQAEASMPRGEVPLPRAGKDCSRRNFIQEFKDQNACMGRENVCAGQAIGLGLAVLAESLSCGR